MAVHAPTSADPPPAVRSVRIWDRPTRLVHWLIVVLVAAAWWTESHDQMQWHLRIGYTLLGVVLFRLIWGLVGGSTARFSSFVRGPATVWRYGLKLVRNQASSPAPGHNPMGGWSVVALLTALSAEVVLGLFAVDVDGIESGPFAGRVSFQAGRVAAHWHALVFDALLALIALHLCAVLFYAIARRENLVRPMLTGRRTSVDVVEPLRPAAWWRAIIAGLAAAAVVAILLRLG